MLFTRANECVCCRGGFDPEHPLHINILPKTRRLPPGQSPGQNHAGLAGHYKNNIIVKLQHF